MSLYLWINILSILVPLLVSFHPRLRLYKEWKYIFPAIFISMLPYIVWDVYFTSHSYWGFNASYINGSAFFHLPIEEILFFICIPYACIFTHYAVIELHGFKGFSFKVTRSISIILLSVFFILAILNFDRAYTFVNAVFAFVILLLVYILDKRLLQYYYQTFLFMLLPFFVVNGILTGSGIEGEIVWYDDMQNLGIRIGTIPIEDSIYAFSLILLNLLTYNILKRYSVRKSMQVQVS